MSKRINKIKNLFLVLTTVLCMVTQANLFATHIVGSDMTFECLGNDFYQVDLTVRRDCVNGADNAQFDDPAFVGIFDFRGNPLDFLGRFGMIEMPKSQIDTIYPGRPDCGYFGGEVCVTEARYRATVYLPFREGGYVLGYQRCCRNVTLNNIVEPLNTGNTSFVCLTEPTLNSCNSSPSFQEWPEIIICANEPLVFEHPAIDRDGDSLSYMLYTPHAGASEDRPKPIPPPGPSYDTIEWSAGYGLDNLLGGEPLKVDPVTGTITATPNTVGQFLVGVLVVEWRDGKVLSKTRRNFEYNVRACQDVAELDFEAPASTCDGLTVAFENTSGENFGFNWNFNASSTDDGFLSTEESPSFTYTEEGFYTVTLSSTNPETDCEVTVTKEIAVFNSLLTSDFTGSASTCEDGRQTIRFVSTASEPNADLSIESYKWEIIAGDAVIPLFGSVVEVELDCLEFIEVSHTVNSSSGCTAQVITSVAVEDLLSAGLFDLVGDTVRICLGSGTELFNSAPDGVVYSWTPTEGLTFGDDVLRNDPAANPTETTLYTVTATDGFSTEEATVLVIVDTNPEFDFGVESTELCRSGSQITTLSGSDEYSYDWSPADQVNTSSPYGPNDPLFSPTAEGYFFVTVTNGACQIVDSVFVTPIGNDPVALDEVFEITPEITLNADGTTSVTVPVNWEDLAQQFDIDSVYWTITTDSEVISGTGMDISATLESSIMATLCVFIVDSEGCTTKITRVLFNTADDLICFISDTIRICLGSSTPLFSCEKEGVVYTWSPTTDLTFSDESFNDPIASPTETTTYTVTANDGSMTEEGTVVVIVDTNPEFDFGVESTELCRSGSQITTISGSDEYTYDWSPSDQVNTSTLYGPNDPLFSPTAEGYFYVTVTNGACQLVDSVYVTPIGNDPVALDEVFEITPEITLNADGTTSVTVPVNWEDLAQQFDIDSVYWTITTDSEVISGTGMDISATLESSTMATLCVFIVDSEGCTTKITRVLFNTADDLICFISDTIRICLGSSTPLFSCEREGVVYTWSPTTDLTFSDESFNDPIASPTETTTYTVTANDGSMTEEGSIVVIVDTNPEFDFGVESTELCRSGSQIPTIDGSDDYSYDWSPSDQVNTLSPYGSSNPLFSPTEEGYFYVTVTNGACQVVDSVYVIPIGNDPMALDAALEITPEVTINEDGTTSITVPVNWEELGEQFDIDSVYWTITTDSDMISGSGMNITATISPSSMATVCIFIVDSEGCTTKITRVIDLDNLPSITFISEDTISVCLGETSLIVANPNSEWTYTWDPEEGLVFDNPEDRSNPRITPTESRYYYVTVSNGIESVTDSIFIQSINDLIDIEITEGEICSGVATVSAQNNTNDDETEYEWSLDPDFATIIASGTTAEIPVEGTPVTIYVRAKSSGFCGSNEASITVIQDDYGIVADVTPINTCISNEGAVSLLIPDTVDVQILWTANENITTEDLTSPNIDIEAQEGQTEVSLMYQVTDSEGCVSAVTIVVPVNDELTVGIEGDTESCTTTGTFSATANANTDSVNFEWSLDPEFGTILSTEEMVTADLGETGIIYLRGIAGSCESEVTQQILEMKDLQLDADAPSRICLGDTADVDLILPEGSNYTITWDAAEEITSSLTGPQVIIVANGGKDTIVLTYTVDDGEGCVFMDEVRIPYSSIIDPDPLGNVECGTQNMNFMIDPIYQDGDIFWNFGEINGEEVTSISATPMVAFDSAGIYMAKISSTMETCNFDATDFFYEVPEILEINTDQDLDQQVCGDDPLMLRATSNGNTITWTDEDNNLLAVGDSVAVDAVNLSTVIATVSDAFGCTMELRFNISMYLFDVTTDAPAEAVCMAGGELIINATDNTNSDLSYMWTSATGIIGDANGASVTVDPVNAGDLLLTVTNAALGCSEEIAVPIALGNIDAEINSSEGTDLDFGESTDLIVTPSGDNYTYVWEDGSTDHIRTVMPDAGTSTTYTVTITDTDTGCTGEATITINVAAALCADDESVFMPTAFSPDNDGMNDVLMVRANGLRSVDLQVVDRWGKEVFRGMELGEGWNGRHKNNGKELSPDVFAYCLRAVCEDGTEILRRGQINLIR